MSAFEREVIEACPELPQLKYRRLFYALRGVPRRGKLDV